MKAIKSYLAFFKFAVMSMFILYFLCQHPALMARAQFFLALTYIRIHCRLWLHSHQGAAPQSLLLLFAVQQHQ